MSLKSNDNSVNLSEIVFLVADPSELYRELVRRLLYGYGAKKVYDAGSIGAAKRVMSSHPIDFLICASDLNASGTDKRTDGGIDFVRSLRLDPKHPQRSIPIIVTMGTARRMGVGQARDCGANFVLSKPLAPAVLYDRITWIARRPRPFWDSKTYYGPDRRFRETSHDGVPKRRDADHEAATENSDVG